MAQVRPQVVAHRGSSAREAEHTLGAYIAALDEGAEALECDVRLSADGHLVCVHDRDLRRTAQRKRAVSTTPLSQLESLDAATWKRPWADLDEDAPESDPAHRTVLTLRKLLETVAAYDRPVELAIETKHPTRYAGLVERRLVQMLEDFGWAGEDSPVRVMSFSWVALRRFRELAPALPLVMLVESVQQYWRSRPFVEPDWQAGFSIEMLRETPELVRRTGDRGVPLHCFVANRESDMQRCLDHGVVGLITDRPAAAVHFLDGVFRDV